MGEHNYKVKSVKLDEQVYLCPDSLCPYHNVDIKVAIRLDPQHDGRPWKNEFVESCEEKVVNGILEALRPQLATIVKHINPFSIHIYND